MSEKGMKDYTIFQQSRKEVHSVSAVTVTIEE